MIKDLQLLKYPDLLLEKKCVIWGAGTWGKKLYKHLLELRGEQSTLLLCDAMPENVSEAENYNILSIEQMLDRVKQNKDEYMILVSVESIKVQDEIIEQIKGNELFDIDIYTLYAAKWGIVFEKRKKGLEIQEQELGIEDWGRKRRVLRNIEKNVNYFMIAPYLEQMIFVYQPGKVGSKAICSSMDGYGVHSFHVHTLQESFYIKEIMQKRNGKIISALRNPLEWTISQFWQLFEGMHCDNLDADFYELQEAFFKDNLKNQEFNWFDREMKNVMDIDIFEYPFDKEQGYTIIKKDNIELLLMVTEKISSLETVIGNFVGIENFELRNSNVGEKKEYRFAYKQYKSEFKIPDCILDSLYADERVKHFYTKEDIEHFKDRWKEHSVDDSKMNESNIKIGVQ